MAANAQRAPLARGRRSIARLLAQLRTTFHRWQPKPPAVHEQPAVADVADATVTAFDKLRVQRTWRYAMEDVNGGAWPDFIADRISAEEQALERRVFGPVSSLAGVVVQLQLLVTYLDEDRWVDRTLMEDGLPAVRQRRSELGAEARLAVEIAYRLSQLIQRRCGR